MSRLECDRSACRCYEYLPFLEGAVTKTLGRRVSCEWRY